MPEIYLTNTLTRKKEKFEPIDPPSVQLYTCGMTVYDYAHIGHGRKYVNDDILKRFLTYSGLKVKHVQNVTDVGHLVSDADEGEDKLEKGAVKSGKTVWEVAEFFTKDFYESMDKLNIIPPGVICKATDNIPEQIALIEKIIKNGYGYDTPEAVYFDISKFAGYEAIFNRGSFENKKVAVRKEIVTGEYKKNPQDFALWFKKVGRFRDHSMHWDSPWGDGFPGWHIECSAMSIKYLGEQIDIHTGGEDHIATHHPNEIAQSEAATGKKPFARFWIHSAFLKVDGKKMSKSLNNFYRVSDIEAKGFDPIALRYLFLSAHYRDPLNFTWESLKGGQIALSNLRSLVLGITSSQRMALSPEKEEKIEKYRDEFTAALADDLNAPKALAVLWQMLKSNIPSEDKYDLAMSFDEVLGLGLGKVSSVKYQVSSEVQKLVGEREKLRKEGKYEEADGVRKKIRDLGYDIEDGPEGSRVKVVGK